MNSRKLTLLFSITIFANFLAADSFEHNGIIYPQGKKSFADKVIAYNKGTQPAARQYQKPKRALGKPDFASKNYQGMVSLGCNGSLTVKFNNNVLADSAGPDLYILEVGPALEDVKVEISIEGTNWILLGTLKKLGKKIDIQTKARANTAYHFVRVTDLATHCDTDTRGADIDAIATLNPPMDQLLATSNNQFSTRAGTIAQPADECTENSDQDGDGHQSLSCGGDDCDDQDANRFPGNIEIEDPQGHDEDCDTSTFGGRDQDGDRFIGYSAFNTSADGSEIRGLDCDDNNSSIHPNASEVCDGIDNNCDGIIDNGVKVEYFIDEDGDLYGNPNIRREACATTEYFDGHHWVRNKEDCNDQVTTINPANGNCAKKN